MYEEPVIYLVELTCYVPGVGEQVLRFTSGGGYVSQPSDVPPDTWYEPRVSQPGLFRQDMYTEGATSGSSRGGYGEIVLVNGDGALDSLIDYGFDGRPVVVREGLASWPLSKFAVVITGTAEQPEASWDNVVIRLRDRTAELAVPVQPHRYAGNNVLPGGVEGGPELAGKPKPRLLGVCNNVTPVCVNTSMLIYQINDGSLVEITAVYDSGVPLEYIGKSYGSLGSMLNTQLAPPQAGTFTPFLDGGYFRLGSPPAGLITCDARAVTTLDRYAPSALSVTVGAVLGGSIEALAVTGDSGNLLIDSAVVNGNYVIDAELYFYGVVGSLGAVRIHAWTVSPLSTPVTQFWIKNHVSNTWELLPVSFPGSIKGGTSEYVLLPTPTDVYVNDGRVELRVTTSPAATRYQLYLLLVVLEPAEDLLQTVGAAAKMLVAEKLGNESITSQSIVELGAMAPGRIGLFTGTEDKTVKACLDELCASVGAWFGFDNLGKFWIKQLQAPDPAQAAVVIAQTVGSNIERLATADSDRGVPAWRVNIDYGRNWTVQTSGLAGSVGGAGILVDETPVITLTPDRAGQLAMEYQRVSAEDAAVVTTHLLAPEITVQTLLAASADAAAEAMRILTMRKVRRDRLRVKLPLDELVPQSPGFWDVEVGTSLTYGIQAPCALVVNGRFYVAGGTGPAAATSIVAVLDLTVTGAPWDYTALPPMPVGRWQGGMAADGDYLYVFGGYSGAWDLEPSVIRINLAVAGSVWETVTPLPAGYELRAWGEYGGYLYVLMSNRSVYRLNLANPSGAWEVLPVPPIPLAAAYQQGAIINGYWYVCGGALPGTVTPYRLNLVNPGAGWEALTGLALASSYLYTIGMDSAVYVLASDKTYRLDTGDLTNGWNDLGIADLPGPRVRMGAGVLNGSIVLVGGASDTDYLLDTILWRSASAAESVSRVYDLGRTILLDMPRYGYTGGRPMRIIGTEADYRARTIKLDLWG